eukprot:sb/3477850/
MTCQSIGLTRFSLLSNKGARENCGQSIGLTAHDALKWLKMPHDALKWLKMPHETNGHVLGSSNLPQNPTLKSGSLLEKRCLIPHFSPFACHTKRRLKSYKGCLKE